jgi:hypothetical protein
MAPELHPTFHDGARDYTREGAIDAHEYRFRGKADIALNTQNVR